MPDSEAVAHGAAARIARSPVAGTGTIAGGGILAVWAWIDLFVGSLTATPGSTVHAAYDLVWIFGAAALLVGVVAAHARYRDHCGRIGRAGLGLSAVGFVGVGLGGVVRALHVLPVETADLGTTVFWAGIGTALVGGLLLAVGGYLTGVPDRLLSGLLAIGPSTMLLELFAAVGLPSELVGASAGFGVSLVPLGIAWMLVGKDVRADRDPDPLSAG